MESAQNEWVADRWKQLFENNPLNHLTTFWQMIGNDVPVYLNNTFFQHYGKSVHVPDAQMLMTKMHQPFIIANEALAGEEAWVIKGLLSHNLGHVNLHHKLINRNVGFDEVITVLDTVHYENEADRYAHRTSDILGVLYRLRDTFNQDVEQRIMHMETFITEQYQQVHS